MVVPLPPLIDCALRYSRSQFREDLILLPTLLAITGGAPGTYVEIGALDGLDASNTLMLERCFNWKGLLIEGNPANFGRLKASGRTATMVHSAVCAQPAGGTVAMTVVSPTIR